MELRRRVDSGLGEMENSTCLKSEMSGIHSSHLRSSRLEYRRTALNLICALFIVHSLLAYDLVFGQPSLVLQHVSNGVLNPNDYAGDRRSSFLENLQPLGGFLESAMDVGGGGNAGVGQAGSGGSRTGVLPARAPYSSFDCGTLHQSHLSTHDCISNAGRSSTSPSSSSSTTTTVTAIEPLPSSQDSTVLHAIPIGSPFSVAGDPVLSAIPVDHSGLDGSLHSGDGILIPLDPPPVLESLPQLPTDPNEHVHDSYHNYYFGDSHHHDDIEKQVSEPDQQQHDDGASHEEKKELEAAGRSTKKPDDAEAVVDMMMDAFNAKLKKAIPGIEVVSKPTLDLAKPFVSTALSLFEIFVTPLLAAKKNGKKKKPPKDDAEYSVTCCSECSEDDKCLMLCTFEDCESKDTCLAAGDGAYSGFCSNVCAAVTGMSVASATAELLPDEVCRGFCAARVRRLCELRGCEDFGCHAEHCAELATLRCG